MKKRNFLLACGFSLIFGLSAAQAAETLKVGALLFRTRIFLTWCSLCWQNRA